MKKQDGSLTVEAALVLPIFIFSTLLFVSLFQVMYIQEMVQYALTETAREASRYGFIYDDLSKDTNHAETTQEKNSTVYYNKINSIVDGSFYRSIFSKYISVKELESSCVKGTFSFLESQFMNDNNEIEILVEYDIKPIISMFGIDSIPIIQKVKTKGFVGTYLIGDVNIENLTEKDLVVYLAENGTVYHKQETCTHLLLSVKTIPIGQVENYRNENGGKYKRCSRCIKEKLYDNSTLIFIAAQGNHYHSIRDCSGLKRTVKEVLLSQIKELPPCKRCGN